MSLKRFLGIGFVLLGIMGAGLSGCHQRATPVSSYQIEKEIALPAENLAVPFEVIVPQGQKLFRKPIWGLHLLSVSVDGESFLPEKAFILFEYMDFSTFQPTGLTHIYEFPIYGRLIFGDPANVGFSYSVYDLPSNWKKLQFIYTARLDNGELDSRRYKLNIEKAFENSTLSSE